MTLPNFESLEFTTDLNYEKLRIRLSTNAAGSYFIMKRVEIGVGFPRLGYRGGN